LTESWRTLALCARTKIKLDQEGESMVIPSVWINRPHILHSEAAAFRPRIFQSGKSFLQSTLGSRAAQKASFVTHRTILRNSGKANTTRRRPPRTACATPSEGAVRATIIYESGTILSRLPWIPQYPCCLPFRCKRLAPLAPGNVPSTGNHLRRSPFRLSALHGAYLLRAA